MKRFLILIALGAMLAGRAVGQSVTVDATIDSLQILIGEQAHIRLEVSYDTDKSAIFPNYRERGQLVPGVEILHIATPDTQLLNGGKRTLITQDYTVTSFDSALYYIPPLEVVVDGLLHQSKPLALKVYTLEVPIDPENPDAYFGPKDVVRAPFVWSDWYGSLTCVVLLIPIVILLIYLIKRFFDNKPIIRKVKIEPKLPAHQLAMQQIERIKSEKVWQKGQSKAYYTELTEALRVYIEDRFGFSAMEMTSGEIIERLMQVQDREALADLRQLFQTADLVKFAKLDPMMSENDANLIKAIDFIDQTKQEEDANAKPQPTEMTIIEKRPLRTKILIGAGVVVLLAGGIFALVYVITQLYTYFA